MTPGKASTVARLDLYLTLADKALIARAAAVLGMSVASFVREVALREAEKVENAHIALTKGEGGE